MHLRIFFKTLLKGNLLSLLVFGVAGCATFDGILSKVGLKKRGAVPIESFAGKEFEPAPEINEAYVTGLEHMKKNEFDKAIEIFRVFTTKYPSSQFAQAALLQLARAYEESQEWDLAIHHYREVITHNATPNVIRSKALYRMSFCYEAKGEFDKVVASLVDVNARRNFLPSEVADAEVPSRLAAAYSRLGNEKLALKYFAVAEEGIRKLRQRSFGEKGGAPTDKIMDSTKVESKTDGSTYPEWLPKTLYYMGTMNHHAFSSKNFDSSVRPLRKSQVYLLEAAEFNHPIWSRKAADRISDIYQSLLSVIDQHPRPRMRDKIYAAKKQLDAQKEMAFQLLDAVNNLQSIQLPIVVEKKSTDVNLYVAEILNQSEANEEKLLKILRRAPVEHDLTETAKRYKTLRREGRAISSETILEKRSLKPSKKIPESRLPAKNR